MRGKEDTPWLAAIVKGGYYSKMERSLYKDLITFCVLYSFLTGIAIFALAGIAVMMTILI